MSITVPADWHEAGPGDVESRSAMHLERNGIPLLEKDSVANFYDSSDTPTNSAREAKLWQERTAKSTVGDFVSRGTEQISGHYTSLCVTGTNREDVEVLDCAVEGAPLTFSFAGSRAAETEARNMLRSMH